MREYQISFYVLGCLLIGLAFFMVVPAVIEVFSGGQDWACFIFSAFLSLFVGGCLFFSQRQKSIKNFGMRQTFLLNALVWLSACVFGALPFYFSQLKLSFTDAFFESTSGLTTTGATVIDDLGLASYGILFWRILLQSIGGMGIAIMAVTILPFLRVGGMQLFKIELKDNPSPGEGLSIRVGQIARNLLMIYVTLIVLCFLAYIFVGLGTFDALSLAMSTISTGGFSNHDLTTSFFANNTGLMWSATLFMLLSSLPLLGFLYLAKGNVRAFFGQPQVRGFLSFVLFMTAVMTLWLSWGQGRPLAEAFRVCFFHMASMLSTTGFVAENYNHWGHFAIMIFIFLLFVGGCTGSTAGGIKIFRFQVLFLIIKTHIHRMLYPHNVGHLRYGHQILQEDVIFSVLAFMAAFIGTAIFSSLLLSLTGLDVLTAISSALQALSNIGLALGEITGPCCSFFSLPNTSKWILSGTMILGRLEVLTVLILFWRTI